MSEFSKRLEILSRNGNYFVTFHETFSSLTDAFSAHDDKYFLIDQKIFDIRASDFANLPSERVFLLEASEENKNLMQVQKIASWMLQQGATKSSHVVAIGGGVIQDLATFVAHIYYRGVSWTFVPTTLLSQADSCIGAKCALNLEGHKNQLGVIHTPSAVEIFPDFLDSLPKSELRSGYGEIAKLSVTGEGQFLGEFSEKLKNSGFEVDGIARIIFLSLRAKKFVIDVDEYESGLRRILNYGHSFGHALETLTSNQLVHGDAVVVGMEIINFIGLRWGITDRIFYDEFKALFDKYFTEIRIPTKILASELVREISRDKKMAKGLMNFAVPVRLGQLEIIEKRLDSEVVELVEEFILESPRFATS